MAQRAGSGSGRFHMRGSFLPRSMVGVKIITSHPQVLIVGAVAVLLCNFGDQHSFTTSDALSFTTSDACFDHLRLHQTNPQRASANIKASLTFHAHRFPGVLNINTWQIYQTNFLPFAQYKLAGSGSGLRQTRK